MSTKKLGKILPFFLEILMQRDLPLTIPEQFLEASSSLSLSKSIDNLRSRALTIFLQVFCMNKTPLITSLPVRLSPVVYSRSKLP